jgi:hypothetical protein
VPTTHVMELIPIAADGFSASGVCIMPILQVLCRYLYIAI